MPTLSLVTLGVRDLDRATAFYRALGWRTVEPPNEGVAFFALPGVVLALFGWDALAQDAGVDAAGTGFRGVALAVNLPSREEVDAFFARAGAAGARNVKPPQATFWGGYGAYFADPDGHLWEVAHNPFWTLDAEGRVVRFAADDAPDAGA